MTRRGSAETLTETGISLSGSQRDHPGFSFLFDDGMGSWTLSDVLGYISICCWLGAQFPSVNASNRHDLDLTPADDIYIDSQVIENVRRKSVEGLSLPFLANWFLGACRVL